MILGFPFKIEIGPGSDKENDYEKNYLVINPASETDLSLVNNQ